PCLENAFYATNEISSPVYLRLNNWIRTYQKRLALDGITPEERKKQMNKINPRYVLRNYLAQTAIDKAENNDFSLVWELLDVMKRPYDDQPGKENFAEKRPEWARHKPGCSMLSCSS
ncbi:MAG: YdiU family protein, partial [Desulfobacula sp.]|nr:YdiU family protein [Desulfobacula sp.]